MAKQFEVIRLFAGSGGAISKRDAFVAIGGLVEKVSSCTAG